MRLIDADATIIGLDTALACSRVVAGKDAIQNKALDIFENARDFVANMPTIDAVPVVRCKDCKYYRIHHDSWGEDIPHCIKAWGGAEVDPMDYCSYGERKDGDTDAQS